MTNLLKAVIWDLDDTIWRGVAVEGDDLELNEPVMKVVRSLHDSDIVQSIASRGDDDAARDALTRTGIRRYFVYPQVNWSDKSESISRSLELLNLGQQNVAFVDNDEYERGQVRSVFPDMAVYDPEDPSFEESLLSRVTDSSNELGERRTELYKSDERRHVAQVESTLSPSEFLATLSLRVGVRMAVRDDLARLGELTRRTNQLNSTGIIYGIDELEELILRDDYLVVVCEVEDRFGRYGTTGLLVAHVSVGQLRVLLQLSSCRIASRGAGSVLVRSIAETAREANLNFVVDFIASGRNRPMEIALRFLGLEPGVGCDRHIGCRLYGVGPDGITPNPSHVAVSIDEGVHSRLRAIQRIERG